MVTKALKDAGNYYFLMEFDLDTMVKIINKMKLVRREKHGSVTIVFVDGEIDRIEALLKEKVNGDNNN